MDDLELIDQIIADEMGGENNAPDENEVIDEEVPQGAEPNQDMEEEENINPDAPTEEEIANEEEKINPQNELLRKLVENQSALQEQNALLQQRIAEQQAMQQPAKPEPELTDEELALKELEERLGVNALKDENAQLKQQLQEVMNFKAEQEKQRQMFEQQQAMKQEIAMQVDRFSKEFPDADQEAIVKVMESAPKEIQAQIDNYNGWVFIHNMLKTQAQPQGTPDRIVSSQSVKKPPRVDTSKMTQQERDVALADEILSLVG